MGRQEIKSGIANFEKKLDKGWFQLKLDGGKNWELRKEDDHRFNTGEIIKYREFDTSKKTYTGRFLIAKVITVGRYLTGLEEGYCLMTDEVIDHGGLIL